MRLSTTATLMTTGLIAVGLTLPATAQSDVTITLDTNVGADVMLEATPGCESHSFSASVLEDDRVQLGQAPVHTQYASFNARFDDTCTAGARSTLMLQGLMEELTPRRATVDPLLRSAAMGFHGTARTRTCTELPNGRFDCQNGTTPVAIELRWTGKGAVTRGGSADTFPQGDGTVIYNRSRYGFREADVVITGTIGARTIDITAGGYIQDGGFLEIMYPEP